MSLCGRDWIAVHLCLKIESVVFQSIMHEGYRECYNLVVAGGLAV